MFSSGDVHRLGDLKRLRLALEALPDETLLTALEARRGRGRDDYPVRAMWRAVVAMIVLQHPSLEALVRELRRNPALLELCGFDPLDRQGRPRCRREAGPDGRANVVVFEPARFRNGVPSAYTFTRFLAAADLEAEEGRIAAMLVPLRGDLMAQRMN